MNENNMKFVSISLYYIVCPALLAYFMLIDLKVLPGSLIVFALFTVVLLALTALIVMYKKKNTKYEFEVNKMYEKVMCILVICELAYSFSK